MILQERQENFFDDTPGTSQNTFFRFLNKKKDDDTPGTSRKLFFGF